MKAFCNQPPRKTGLSGPPGVKALLKRLDLVSESVLVIRGDELLTDDIRLRPEDVI